MMSNTKDLLLVFVKNPRPGRVKTRLAETLGDRKAMQIYRLLLHYTREILKPLEVDIQVWYSDFIPTRDMWDENGLEVAKYLQQGRTLGVRMKNAFEEAFAGEYDRTVIIGTDCGELTTDIVRQAFEALASVDVVIGPSVDGGYYLLGMKEPHPGLFEDKAWSTPELLRQTIRHIDRKSLTSSMLPRLNDVDTEEDWVQIKDTFKDEAGWGSA